MNGSLYTDAPLKNPEDDRLGFRLFAEKVADTIRKLETKESVVFTLYGKWGSGKSTFLNFVADYLKNDKSITIVKFNPWWFSDRGELLDQFFNNFKRTLGESKSDKLKRVVEAIQKFAGVLRPLPYGGVLASVIESIDTSQTAEEIKEEICDQLESYDGKILIMIDDIDRLSAQEIRELFMIVKAVADFPNTVYLLAFDKDVVVRALESFQEGKGEEYLEKIVQIPMELPLLDKESIRDMVKQELIKILSGTPNNLWDERQFLGIYREYISPFINTVREAKRLINTISITYPPVRGDVNPIDFVAIETIRVFYPRVYSLIKNNPEMFWGLPSVIENKQELIRFHQKWLPDLPNNFRDNIKILLMYLFPKLKQVFYEKPPEFNFEDDDLFSKMTNENLDELEYEYLGLQPTEGRG